MTGFLSIDDSHRENGKEFKLHRSYVEILCKKHEQDKNEEAILVPRGRAPFGQHQEITTSGLVQRHSVFEWLCEHNRLKPEPIRFVRLDSEHAQSDGKSVNRGLPVLDQARGRDFLVLTKRSAASGDENVKRSPSIVTQRLSRKGNVART